MRDCAAQHVITTTRPENENRYFLLEELVPAFAVLKNPMDKKPCCCESVVANGTDLILRQIKSIFAADLR
jgi:hypothetical protein